MQNMRIYINLLSILKCCTTCTITAFQFVLNDIVPALDNIIVPTSFFVFLAEAELSAAFLNPSSA